MWKNMEKSAVFLGDMAGLGKYSTGGYGWIEVYTSMVYSAYKLYMLYNVIVLYWK